MMAPSIEELSIHPSNADQLVTVLTYPLDILIQLVLQALFVAYHVNPNSSPSYGEYGHNKYNKAVQDFQH